MNSEVCVGTSHVTRLKWETFEYFMAVHVNSVKAALTESPRSIVPAYIYLDLYAGPGLYEQSHDPELAGEIGSPIIAIRRLKASGMEFVPYLADASPEICDQLRNSLIRDGHSEHVGRVFKACCALSVDRMLCWHTTRSKYGLIFADPNGQPDWEAIRLLSKSDQWYNVDMLLNVNAVAHKRQRGRFKDQQCGRPSEYLRALRKRYIWLWTPEASDSWQFTLAFCTNRKAPPFRKHAFHEIDSVRGREITDLIDLPKRERETAISASAR